MSSARQIEYRMDQAKKKLAKLNNELTTTKANIQDLNLAFKKARFAKIAKVAKMREIKKADEKTGEKENS